MKGLQSVLTCLSWKKGFQSHLSHSLLFSFNNYEINKTLMKWVANLVKALNFVKIVDLVKTKLTCWIKWTWRIYRVFEKEFQKKYVCENQNFQKNQFSHLFCCSVENIGYSPSSLNRSQVPQLPWMSSSKWVGEPDYLNRNSLGDGQTLFNWRQIPLHSWPCTFPLK